MILLKLLACWAAPATECTCTYPSPDTADTAAVDTYATTVCTSLRRGALQQVEQQCSTEALNGNGECVCTCVESESRCAAR